MASTESEIEALVVKLEADVTSFRAQMMAGQTAVVESSKAMEKAIAEFSEKSHGHMSAFHRIAEHALGVFGGEALFEGIHKAGELIVDVFKEMGKEGVHEAAENETAMNRLATQMALTGSFSHKSMEEMKKFSESLAEHSTVAQSTAVSQLALAKTFGATDEQARKIVQVATDIASTGFMDLNSATRAVSATLGGFTRGIDKLSPELKGLSEEALKSGQGIDILAKRLQGSAERELQTFAGGVQHSKNAFGELSEEIGRAVVENQVVTSVIHEVGEAFGRLQKWVKENEKELKVFVADGIRYAIIGLEFMVEAIDKIYRTGVVAFNALHIAAAKLGSAFGILNESFAAKKIADDTAAIKKALDGPTAGAKKLSEELARIEHTAETSTRKIASGMDHAKDPVNQVHKAVKSLSLEMQQAGDAGKKLADSLLDKNVKKDIDKEVQLLKAQHDAKLISETKYRADRRKLIDQQEKLELTQLKAAENQRKISHSQYQAAVLAEHKKTAEEKKLLEAELTKAQLEQNKQRAQDQYATLGFISQLQQSSVQELFVVGKAAAMATATIDGIAAVQKALSAFPPPFNFAMAGLVGAAAAVNITKIASAQPPKFNQGGKVPGQGFGDKTLVAAEPGEEIIDRSTSEKARKFFGGDNAMFDLLKELVEEIRGMRAEQKGEQGSITIQIGGRTIAEVLRQEIRSGRLVFA